MANFISPEHPNYSAGIARLNELYRLSKRHLLTIAQEDVANFDIRHLQMILDGQVGVASDEVVRLCLFGFHTSFEEMDGVLVIFSMRSLAKRSRKGSKNADGLMRLNEYRDNGGKQRPSLRFVGERSGGLSASLIHLILAGERPATRPVVIRLCGWGWKRTLADTNDALNDFDFELLVRM